MDSIGARFKHARKVRQLTQREAAAFFEVDAGTVSRWERGESPLTLSMLESASKLFGVDRVWLVFGEGQAPAALPGDSQQPDGDDEDDEAGDQPCEAAS